MEEETLFVFPIEFEFLKATLRKGLDTNEDRQRWWPVLPQIWTTEPIAVYPDIIATAERLCVLMKEPLLDIKNQNPFDAEKTVEFINTNLKMIFYVMKSNQKIELGDIPYFDVMLRIIIYVVKRIDVSYMMAVELLNRKDKYLTPGPVGHHVMLYTFKELLNKHAPKTYTVLNTIGALDSRYLNLMFVDLFVEILPEYVHLAMMDAFLLEGIKVLYRFGLALVLGYKQQLKAGKYTSGSHFWSCIKADAVAAAQDRGSAMLCKVLGNEEVLPVVDPFLLFENAKNKAFIQEGVIFDIAFDTERSLVAKASKPLNISRATLKTLAEAAEKTKPAVQDVNSPIARKSMTLGARKTSITETMIEKNSQSSDVKNATMSRKSSRASLSPASRLSMTDVTSPKSPDGSPMPTGKMSPEREKPMDLNVLAGEMDAESSVLNIHQATFMLNTCIPPLVCGFTLRFTTKLDGWNLSALYAATADLYPCLLLISLLPPYDHVVLGSYINTNISPPSLAVRGDVSTTIFNLNLQDPKLHQFCGSVAPEKLARTVADDIANEGLENGSEEVLESATVRQFVVATNHYITVGGSREHGTNALRLDENMKFVHVGASDTFGNPPMLVPEGADGSAPSYQFEVENVELWCGTNSYHAAKRLGKIADNTPSIVR